MFYNAGKPTMYLYSTSGYAFEISWDLKVHMAHVSNKITAENELKQNSVHY